MIFCYFGKWHTSIIFWSSFFCFLYTIIHFLSNFFQFKNSKTKIKLWNILPLIPVPNHRRLLFFLFGLSVSRTQFREICIENELSRNLKRNKKNKLKINDHICDFFSLSGLKSCIFILLKEEQKQKRPNIYFLHTLLKRILYGHD